MLRQGLVALSLQDRGNCFLSEEHTILLKLHFGSEIIVYSSLM